mmetsp:Transcript_99785/g.168390  ORF Transcript_99785/g.168390 Transcript_99785/m.168390 type:complete len:144 (+) Transcript_99785:731-1162(+)
MSCLSPLRGGVEAVGVMRGYCCEALRCNSPSANAEPLPFPVASTPPATASTPRPPPLRRGSLGDPPAKATPPAVAPLRARVADPCRVCGMFVVVPVPERPAGAPPADLQICLVAPHRTSGSANPLREPCAEAHVPWPAGGSRP